MFDVYQDIFNQRGREYHEAMGLCPHARDREFELMINRLDCTVDRRGLTVCDMPSGGGYLAGYLPGAVDRLIGIETAKAFYDLAPETDRFKKRLAELHDTGLSDDAADAVLSVAGLHHVQDMPAVFAEMRRITRPGNAVVICDVMHGSPQDLFLDGFVNEHSTMGHSGRFVTERTPRLMQSAGLRVGSVAHEQFAWRFATEQQMVRFCKLLFGIDQASDAQIAEAIERILGTRRDAQGVSMNWGLTYITSTA